MEVLIQTYKRLLQGVEGIYIRDFYKTFNFDNRFVGIIGARGVGKTTFLLNYLKQNYDNTDTALYVSADNLYFTNHTLVDLVSKFVEYYGGKVLAIDEIHRYKNWNQELKNIYDSYPDLKVIFSGSSSLELIKGKYDLSRRVILRHMPGFSFREYLEYTNGANYSKVALKDLFNKTHTIEKELKNTEKILGHFSDYLKKGYYPTSFEIHNYAVFKETLNNIIDKTVFEDISSFYSLKTQNLDTLKKLLYFFSTALPGGLSVNKLSNSLGKDNATISQYIQILRDTGLLRFLLNDKVGHALVRNAEKIYLSNTNLLCAINSDIGKKVDKGVIRETYIVCALKDAGHKVFYSKKGDLIVDKVILEIGGKRKGQNQLKGVDGGYIVKDEILYKSGNIIPLHFFGFLG
jgi:uncharacterized protein